MQLPTQKIFLTECPRDAMQGLSNFIPTKNKVAYINALLQVGFDTLDFGSFVSHRLVPQMSDTVEVLEGLDLSGSSTKLLAIVANLKGALDALAHNQISYLGFPLSVSEIFQLRNTNKRITAALQDIAHIQAACAKAGKELLVYISMAFGNPYNEPYSPKQVLALVDKLDALQIKQIALSDTIGVSTAANIEPLFKALIPAYPPIRFGAHLHSLPQTAHAKISAAYAAGCRSFDTAILGLGGCPMANDNLVGNLATEQLLAFFDDNQIPLNIDRLAFQRARTLAIQIFGI